ncbi:hypothetical protein C7447_102465 [Tenacibaculum adriaticum]|uniref:Uncharacterized protein n=1 Tax=Tenacibaculum adriaticum TaxID=413713 RepID=A0A5S5DVT2_9FLAO|nr:hypothetical protein [Tenacibaculum adriaticum]TYP99146.1 hypothetical protein C7447_102465 [Tenacibaculum adriaticum]
MKKIKNISTSLFFSIVLFMPFLVQIVHSTKHHEKEEICYSKKEKHFHNFEGDSCDICLFHLSNFIYKNNYLYIAKLAIKSDFYSNLYSFVSSLNKFYFSLRGPPVLV